MMFWKKGIFVLLTLTILSTQAEAAEVLVGEGTGADSVVFSEVTEEDTDVVIEGEYSEEWAEGTEGNNDYDFIEGDVYFEDTTSDADPLAGDDAVFLSGDEIVSDTQGDEAKFSAVDGETVFSAEEDVYLEDYEESTENDTDEPEEEYEAATEQNLDLGASVTSGNCGENVTWNYDSTTKTLTISGSGRMDDCQALATTGVPYNTSPWRANGQTIRNEMKYLVIEEGVTYIGERAFEPMSGRYGAVDNLIKVTLPSTLTEIGSGAFANCEHIAELALPVGLDTIGEYAFSGCSKLTKVTVPENVKRIEAGTFSSCYALAEVELPNALTFIGKGSFNGTALTDVVIPPNVTEIGEWAFQSCAALTTVKIPGKMLQIKERAFNYCTALTKVVYGGSEEQWNEIQIAQGNDCLTNAKIEYGIIIENMCGVDAYWKLDEKGVLTIYGTSDMAWTDPNSGKTVWTSPDLYSAGDTAILWEAPWLTQANDIVKIVIEDGITSIAPEAFKNCVNAKTISIPASVIKIDNSAFTGCGNLKFIYENNDGEHETEGTPFAKKTEEEKPTMMLNFSGTLPMKTKQTFKGVKVLNLAAGDSVAQVTSSNKKVLEASYKNGQIVLKAKKKTGTVTVTVTLKSKYKTTFKVKVQKKAVKAKKITLASKPGTLSCGKTFTVQASVTPITAPQLKFKSSNKKVLNVSGKGVIKAIKKGKATVTVSSGKKKVKFTVNVK